MSKILSEKQKEVLMQARKNGKAWDLADIIKKSKDMGDVEAKEADPFENWNKGQEMAGKLFLGSGYADIIVEVKTANVFSKLLDMGLDQEDLQAVIDEVNTAD